MRTHAGKDRDGDDKAGASKLQQTGSVREPAFQLRGSRSEHASQRQLSELANASAKVLQQNAFRQMANGSVPSRHLAQLQATVVQQKKHDTGLPDSLKTGIENLSGYSLDDVKVHYNSAAPARLQAHAFAQGTDIHLASGQEKHLPHEAWHVVQQKQGRVGPTVQMKGGEHVNDDAGLEAEADLMGNKAIQPASAHPPDPRAPVDSHPASMILPVFQLQDGDYNSSEDNSEKIRSRQKQGLLSIELTEALNKKKWRKVNRLTGDLYKRGDMMISLIPGVLSSLWSLLETLRDELPAEEKQRTQSRDLMALIDTGLESLLRKKLSWHEFDTLSMLGPLVHWLNEGKTEGYPTSVNAKLRKMRHEQALREGLSVVAHRGAGPTNRTRGGLIGEDDPRRTSRPAENSPDAFNAALTEATTVGKVGLDGVECDVFLSSDGLPILSHEGAVREQLNRARKDVHTALTDGTHVDDLTRAELVQIQRNESAGSNFMDIAGFLTMIVPTAHNYYTATGKPFRIEIEMKGKPHGTPGPDTPLKHPEGYKAALIQMVAKAISKFKQANPALPVEIIMFNGDKKDPESFGKLRGTKSRLGGLYTGWGGDSAVTGETLDVDELRMSATVGNAALIGHERFKQFILTLVPGSELDQNPARPEMNSFQPLTFTPDLSGLEERNEHLENAEHMELDRLKPGKIQQAAIDQCQGETNAIKARLEKIKAQKSDLFRNNLAHVSKSKAKKGGVEAPISKSHSLSQEDFNIARAQLEEAENTAREQLAEANKLLVAAKGLPPQSPQLDALRREITANKNQIAHIRTVERDMRAPGAIDKEGILMIRKKIEAGAQNVHLLTDTPHNAAGYKKKLPP